MSSAWSMPLRAFATQTAVITMIGIGLAAPASAAPGGTPSDNANDTATTAKAEASAKQSARVQVRVKASIGGSSTRGSSSTSHGKGLDDDRHTPMGEQPVSGADLNLGGANGNCSDTEPDDGYFCGTARTQASGNGQGQGVAVGKPYQAHKGKADNKNPAGQVQSDHNNGYECDGNQGIAKGNPAHTSCVSVTTGGGGGGGGGFTPPGPPTVTPPGIGGVDTGVPGSNRPPVVAGVDTLVPPAGVEMVRPPTQAAPQALPGAAALPATGSTPAMRMLSALAFGLLALGSGLLMYRRVTA